MTSSAWCRAIATPTCNLHDWYVGVRNGKVECLWPVSARGKAF